MGCFSVEQRTKDGMFNATALLKQWNESAGEKKELKKFFENQNTFAMWLNPRFEVKVIKFIYDQMIAYRNGAGDAYRELSIAVAKIVAPNFMQSAMKQIAQAINYCVFNEHETAIRNKHGEESKMRQLFELERKVASLIDEGFITKFDNVIEYLRNQWRRTNTPKVFQSAILK